MRDGIRGHVEIDRIVDDLPRQAVIDSVNAHGLLEEFAEVKKLDRKPLFRVGEEGVVGVVGDLAPRLVIDLRGDFRRRNIRLAVGLLDQPLRFLLERLKGERMRLAELHGAGLRLRRLAADGPQSARRRSDLEKRAAILLVKHG